MKIREWVNIFLILTAIAVYSTVLVVVDLSGVNRYLVLILGIALFGFIGLKTYRSSDKEALATYVREHTDRKSDVFEEARCVIARETSESPFVITQSYLLYETLGRAELQEMLDLLTKWKADNNFEWNEHTVYDTLNMEATAEKDLAFTVHQEKHTKTFQIKGELCRATATYSLNLSSESEKNQVYTISGLNFLLANVQPDDVGKFATWSISIDERFSNVYTGIITSRAFLGGVVK